MNSLDSYLNNTDCTDEGPFRTIRDRVSESTGYRRSTVGILHLLGAIRYDITGLAVTLEAAFPTR
jgi:hypothetical protein